MKMLQRWGRALTAPRQAFAFADAHPGQAATDAFIVLALYFVVTSPGALVEAYYYVAGGEVMTAIMGLFSELTRSFQAPLFFLLCGFAALSLLSFNKRTFWAQFDRACVALIPLVVVHLLADFLLVSKLASARTVAPAANILGYAASGLWAALAVFDARKHPAGQPFEARRFRRHWLAGILFALLLVADAVVNVMQVARTLPQRKPMMANTDAPGFVLRAIEANGMLGHDVSLSNYRGKIVLLDFWATWCGPCQSSMPTLKRFVDAYRDKGVNMVSILVEGPEVAPLARQMANKLIPGIEVVCDEFNLVQNAYRATSLPMMVIVDQNGRVAMVHRGFPGADALYEDLREAVEPLLGNGKEKDL